MKKLAILSIGLLLSSGFWQSQTAEAMPNVQVNFQLFYNELSPYGDWVQDPTYGFVWIPWVEQGFQPYLTNGHWTMTNFGNTWISHYPWGWAPFHYGRWFWSDFYGWAWIPGYEWGPSWVSWRSGGGFFGWAPLGPSFGVGFNNGFAAHHWVFIPQRRFMARNFFRYCVPFNQVNLIYNRTTFINNTIVYNNQTFYTGPSRMEVERVTRTRVPVYEVRNSSRPGRTIVNNNGVNLYRPNLTNSIDSRASSRPQRFYSQDEYRSRVANNNQQNARSRNTNSSRNANAAAPSRSQMNATSNQSRTRNQEMVNPNSASDRNVRSNASQNVRSNQSPRRNQEMLSPNSGSSSNVRSNNANTNNRTMQRSFSPQVQRQVSSPNRRQSAPRSSSSVNSSNQSRVQSSPSRSSSSSRSSQVGRSSSNRQQPSVSRSSSNSSSRSGSYNRSSSGSSNRSATSGSSRSNSRRGN